MEVSHRFIDLIVWAPAWMPVPESCGMWNIKQGWIDDKNCLIQQLLIPIANSTWTTLVTRLKAVNISHGPLVLPYLILLAGGHLAIIYCRWSWGGLTWIPTWMSTPTLAITKAFLRQGISNMLVTPAKAARMLRRFVKSASSRYAVGKVTLILNFSVLVSTDDAALVFDMVYFIILCLLSRNHHCGHSRPRCSTHVWLRPSLPKYPIRVHASYRCHEYACLARFHQMLNMFPLSCGIFPPFHRTWPNPSLVWFHIRHVGLLPCSIWNTVSICRSFCYTSDDVRQEASYVDLNQREMAGSGSCHSQCGLFTSVYLLIRWRLQRSKGMPLIILIRMSTLVPWAWSNSLFAVSFSDVE